MTITARIVADSISPQGIRLTTMQLRYPRMIHSEFMTHRVFSRNASSSRAIPVERLIQDVLDDPAMPVYWGSNKPGMQAGAELTGDDLENAKTRWLDARDDAVNSARLMADCGTHKQIVNRIIEPWCHINVVVTATDWQNFYALRRHPDAQPEMKALADAMWIAQAEVLPKPLQPGDWHLPYVSPDDAINLGNNRSEIGNGNRDNLLIRLSVARCARVSYLTHEGKPPNIEDDLKLYDRLVGATPLHASPAEHQATPDHWSVWEWDDPSEHGNFTGWRQYRKMLPHESHQ